VYPNVNDDHEAALVRRRGGFSLMSACVDLEMPIPKVMVSDEGQE
jgi:hypothetical protein